MNDFIRASTPLLATFLLIACTGGQSPMDATIDGDAAVDAPPPDVYVPNRAPGVRAPLTAACDAVDGTRCLLPWPSNTFTAVDSTSATGLRLAVTSMGIGSIDTPISINRSDGFSRVTPIMTGFPGTVDLTTLGDLTTGAVRLLVEQPGPTFGQLVPLRFNVVKNGDINHPQSAIIAYPRVPLAPATDYAVVVLDSAHTTDGMPLTADRNAQVALGLAAPYTPAEGALYAYDAPARMALTAAGIDPQHAVRIWDFTTRSLTQPTTDLLAMRQTEIAAYDGGTGVGLAIDSVTPMTTGTVALVVEGRITGLPSYLAASGSLTRGSDGSPMPMGVHDAPFRVAIPTGTGDYRIVMYGHGTGGNYHDDNFDAEITSAGAAKVGMNFIGWTDTSIFNTFALLDQILAGSEISTAGLMQSVVDGMVIQHALTTMLGDTLAGATLNGTTNPTAGRRPNMAQPVWAGGSLGGTMGFVYAAAEPSIVAAVLNVPGAAWTHFVPYSTLFAAERLIVHSYYPTDIDIFLGVATSQTNWDPIDGAAWYDAVGDHHPILLEQESIGDPVLPNIGNEMVAAASHAQQVGVVLSPIATCDVVAQATNHSGMSQFQVPSTVTAPLDIHGFAARSSPAGVAAQQQIQAFIQSVWAGTPTITIPPTCVTNTPANSCNFSGS